MFHFADVALCVGERVCLRITKRFPAQVDHTGEVQGSFGCEPSRCGCQVVTFPQTSVRIAQAPCMSLAERVALPENAVVAVDTALPQEIHHGLEVAPAVTCAEKVGYPDEFCWEFLECSHYSGSLVARTLGLDALEFLECNLEEIRSQVGCPDPRGEVRVLL